MLKELGLSKSICVFEINVDNLFSTYKNDFLKHNAISRFPSVTMEQNFVFNKYTEIGEIQDKILSFNNLIKEVNIVDVYSDEKLNKDLRKSVSIKIIYQSNDKTLSDKEMLIVHNKLIEFLSTIGAEIRK